MSTLPEISRRIKAVEDTRKITKAMYLLSSAKMQKALKMHERNTPYFTQVSRDMRYIIENSDEALRNPYFTKKPGKRAAYLIISGDKGMCGSYNEDLLRLADQTLDRSAHDETFVFTIGSTAFAHFTARGLDPDVHYLHVAQNPEINSARSIALELCDLYKEDRIDEAYIIFTNMLKGRVLRPEVLCLLPLVDDNFRDVPAFHEATAPLEYIPSAQDALNALVPQHIIGLVHSACVQAFAGEHNARMMAMDASTRNADEMLGGLKTDLNRARQASITREINEIVAGADSVQ